jgi:hypothetical protein
MTQKEAETDALDVTEIGCRERLSDFLYKREYLEACDYCDGRCRATTKPHIQAKEVLEYVHD